MTNFSNLLDYLYYKYEYLKEALEQLPRVILITSKGHRIYRQTDSNPKREHYSHTPEGKVLEAIYNERLQLTKRLKDIDSAIQQINKHLKFSTPVNLAGKRNLTQCRSFFGDWDKLIIKPNTKENKRDHYHNGQNYDSKAEVSVAEIYEALNVPFLHSACINFPDGYSFAADFVPLIEETGDYFIHEHCGMDMNGNYLARIQSKYDHIHRANLIIGRDAIFSYENAENFSDKTYYFTSISALLVNIINSMSRDN